jgi:predicted nucleic acid-binding protein
VSEQEEELARYEERRDTEQLLSRVRWAPVDEAVGVTAGAFGRHLGRGYALAVPDLLVAATAERLGLPLATRNVRDYPMFPGLEPAYRC